MINNDKYEEILESGLLLDHYLVLCSIKNGVTLPNNKRIQGFLNLLTKKGYIQDEQLTESGMKMVEHCHSSITYNSNDWATSLHKKLQDRIIELTGKKQKFLNIAGTKYPFLCNPQELEGKIEKVKKLYKLTDMNIIEKCLLRHCENGSPSIFYYILREKPTLISQLATDYNNFEEDETPKYTGTQKFV